MVALDLDKVVSERCQLSAKPRGLLVYYHGFCEQDGLQLVCHLPGAMGCGGWQSTFYVCVKHKCHGFRASPYSWGSAMQYLRDGPVCDGTSTPLTSQKKYAFDMLDFKAVECERGGIIRLVIRAKNNEDDECAGTEQWSLCLG